MPIIEVDVGEGAPVIDIRSLGPSLDVRGLHGDGEALVNFLTWENICPVASSDRAAPITRKANAGRVTRAGLNRPLVGRSVRGMKNRATTNMGESGLGGWFDTEGSPVFLLLNRHYPTVRRSAKGLVAALLRCRRVEFVGVVFLHILSRGRWRG